MRRVLKKKSEFKDSKLIEKNFGDTELCGTNQVKKKLRSIDSVF